MPVKVGLTVVLGVPPDRLEDVAGAAASYAVAAGEAVAGPHARVLRHVGADHRFERRLPRAASTS